LGRYLIKRLFEGLITLWLITLAVFFILRLGGGNPVEYMLPPEATQADIDKLTKAYGFDKPLIQQYWIFNTRFSSFLLLTFRSLVG
jgi:peptide/nickel transport system permease protein